MDQTGSSVELVPVAVFGVVILAMFLLAKSSGWRRSNEVGRFCRRFGLSAVENDQIVQELRTLSMFDDSGSDARWPESIFQGEIDGVRTVLFDLVDSMNRRIEGQTVLGFRLDTDQFPSLVVWPLDFIERNLGVPSPDPEHIEVPDNLRFTNTFYVRSGQKEESTVLLDQLLIRRLLNAEHPFAMELDHGWLLVYRKNKLLGKKDLALLMDFGRELRDCLSRS